MDGGASQWPCSPAALALLAHARSRSLGTVAGPRGEAAAPGPGPGFGPAVVNRLFLPARLVDGFIFVRVPGVPWPGSLAPIGVPCREP